jgi:hypothetical protein
MVREPVLFVVLSYGICGGNKASIVAMCFLELKLHFLWVPAVIVVKESDPKAFRFK